MDQINAILTQIDSLQAALARAHRGLAAAAEEAGTGYEQVREQAIADAVRFERDNSASTRSALAEIRRQKGPMAVLRWTGSKPAEPLLVEIIRRTEKRVVLLNGHRGRWYDLGDGREIGKDDHWLGEWRITDDSLDQIRAMPVGENAVSRAFKAAKP